MEFVPERFQLSAHFRMVVYLTIEDDGRVPIVRAHGLVAKRRQVNDLQPHSAERDISLFEDTLLVRPAMRDALNGGLNASVWRGTILMRESGYAAQMQGS